MNDTIKKAALALAETNPELAAELLTIASKISTKDLKPGLKIKNKKNPEWGEWRLQRVRPGDKSDDPSWEVKGPRGEKVIDSDELTRFWVKANTHP